MYQLRDLSSSGEAVDLSAQRINIGRDPGNNLALDDDLVSGFHASIFFDNGRTELADLGSMNGSFVNGQKVQGRVVLNPWDKVRFGETEFEIVDPNGRRPTSVQPAVGFSPSEETVSPQVNNQGPVVARLCLQSAGGYPREMNVSGEVTVGRTGENTLCIDRPTMSSKHAKLAVVGDRVEVVDLGSTNGTYVNGNKVSQQLLAHGDRIRFDEVEYTLEYSNGGARKTEVNTALGNQPSLAGTAINPAVSANVFASTGPQATATTVDAVPGRPMAPPPVSGPSPFVSSSGQRTAAQTNLGAPPVMPPPVSGPTPVALSSGQRTAAQTNLGSAPPVMPPPNLSGPRPSAQPVSQASTDNAGLSWLLFSFEGRIARMQFFLSMLVLGLINGALSSVVQLALYGEVAAWDIYSPDYASAAMTSMLVGMIFMWPGLALTAKRFHDTGRSGHWFWLLIIPFVNIYAAIVLYFFAGDDGANQYGARPQ